MQIVIADYDCGCSKGLMIGRVHFNTEKYDPKTVAFHIEWNRPEEAWMALEDLLSRMEIRPAAYYTIIYVADAAIYRLMISVGKGNIIDYEFIDYKGNVMVGRFFDGNVRR